MIDSRDLRKVTIGLWIVFWGWVIYPVAFLTQALSMVVGFESLNNDKYHVAPLVYIVCHLLAFVGVVLLATVKVSERYTRAMIAVAVTVALRPARLFLVGFRFADPRIPFWATHLYGAFLGSMEVLAAAGLVLLCVAMTWLCTAARLPESVRRWRTTNRMLLLTVLLPFTACAVLGTVHIWRFERLHATSVVYFYFFIAFCIAYIPLIYFAVATYYLRREAETVWSKPSGPDFEEAEDASKV